MESQLKNPEFINNPENSHPCKYSEHMPKIDDSVIPVQN